MPGGRPPTPTAVLKITGGFRKSRHGGRENEPQPEGEPAPLFELAGDAAVFWEQEIPGLVKIGVATAVDSAELTAMCVWWAEWRSWQTPEVVKENKYRAMTGAVASYKQFRSIASKFGMTAGDRTALRINDKPTKPAIPARQRG